MTKQKIEALIDRIVEDIESWPLEILVEHCQQDMRHWLQNMSEPELIEYADIQGYLEEENEDED